MKTYVIMCYPKSVPVSAETPEAALLAYRAAHPDDTRDYYFTGAHNTWVPVRGKEKELVNPEERARIGARIAELRKQRNLTQRDLAELAGMNPSNIGRIETGRYSVGFDVLARIADVLRARVELVPREPV